MKRLIFIALLFLTVSGVGQVPAIGGVIISNEEAFELWDISDISKNDSLYIGDKDSRPMAMCFSFEGYELYLVGRYTDSVYQYDLTTAWDISTASYSSKSFYVGNQQDNPNGIYVGDNDHKLYISGYSPKYVFQYSMSTAGDISTASYDNKSVIHERESSPEAFTFSDNGEYFYISGSYEDRTVQWKLTTAWDISTTSGYDTEFHHRDQEENVSGIDFNPNGKQFYLIGGVEDSLFQYTLNSTWDVSTASYDNVSFYIKNTQIMDFVINPEGTSGFLLDYSTKMIYQYTITQQ